ncbi:hypothetical protein B7463_g5209, partial [Scytalidium lignicola]
MLEPTSGMTSNQPVRACVSCKIQKRRCDKTFPACTYCTRLYWTVTDILFFALEGMSYANTEVRVRRGGATGQSLPNRYSMSPRAETSLLLLCVRLITQSHSAFVNVLPAQTPEYLAAKRFYADVEAAGVNTIQVLQAAILIALYELGHAIYPRAYLSIGVCVRYAIAFGFDGNGMTQGNMPYDWIEAEERKRAWWAVLIIDRFVNLGTPTRQLVVEDPESTTILPMDDEAWDSGVQGSNESFTLSSPSSLSMGRFARFAQATYLLGRVLRHTRDHTADANFHEEEAVQLRRTLHALVNLAQVEERVRQLEFCTQISICYSALLILGDPETVPSSENSIIEAIAKVACQIAKDFLLGLIVPLEKISPFMLHLIYHSAVIYMEINQETRSDESAQALNHLKKTLRVVEKRWKAAGVYLEILKAREITHFT